MQIWNDIVTMLKAPFSGQLDLQHLFLIVVLIIVIAASFAMLLNHVRLAETAELV